MSTHEKQDGRQVAAVWQRDEVSERQQTWVTVVTHLFSRGIPHAENVDHTGAYKYAVAVRTREVARPCDGSVILAGRFVELDPDPFPRCERRLADEADGSRASGHLHASIKRNHRRHRRPQRPFEVGSTSGRARGRSGAEDRAQLSRACAEQPQAILVLAKTDVPGDCSYDQSCPERKQTAPAVFIASLRILGKEAKQLALGDIIT